MKIRAAILQFPVCRVLICLVLALILGDATHTANAQTRKPANAAPPAPARNAAPTYARDIAPIVQAKCAPCHRPNGPGPFSLLRYQDVFRRAPQIAVVTGSRYMPPWKPSANTGPFHDENRLTDAQIAKFKAWAEAGAPEGNPAAAPAPPHFSDDWKLGRPDLILEMPESFTLRADAQETQELYRCFILKVPLDADVSVSAVEYHPSNPRIVRHITLFEDSSGISRKLQSQSGAAGYTAFHAGLSAYPAGSFYDWTPGVAPRPLPEGVARPLKKGTDLVLLMRFVATGRPESERSKIGLYFAKKPPRIAPVTLMLGASELYLKPNTTATVTDSYTLPVAAQVFGLVPNAHNAATHIKATATLPDGATKTLLDIPDWDLDWKAPYRLVTPVHLPAQTKIAVSYLFDNTKAAPVTRAACRIS